MPCQFVPHHRSRRRQAGSALPCALLAALALAAFALLACVLQTHATLCFDLPLMWWVHGHASPPLDVLMVGVSWLGSSWVVVPLLALVVWRLRLRAWVAAYFLLASGGAMLLNVALKHYFARPRPAYWPPLMTESTFSFPSGHAVHSAGLVAALLILRWGAPRHGRVALAAMLYVVAVGLSRVYVGVHYPSDVLAGWYVASAWALGLAAVLWPTLSRHRAATVLAAAPRNGA